MVKFILGAKGTGKTKWLIDNANKDMKEGNGNIIFIDVDDNHIFSLNYNVRLINAMEFNIVDIDSFYGFLCGIISMDYDIEKIYVEFSLKHFQCVSLICIFEKIIIHENYFLQRQRNQSCIYERFFRLVNCC